MICLIYFHHFSPFCFRIWSKWKYYKLTTFQNNSEFKIWRLSYYHSQLQLMTSESSNSNRFTLNIENIRSTVLLYFSQADIYTILKAWIPRQRHLNCHNKSAVNVSTSEQWVLLSSLCPAGCDFEFNLWHNCVSFAFRSSDGLKFQLCVILFDNRSWYRSNIYMKKIATVASNNIREVPTAFCQNSFKYI